MNKRITNYLKYLNEKKLIGPQKIVITWKLLFINKNSGAHEKNIKQVIKTSYFSQQNPE